MANKLANKLITPEKLVIDKPIKKKHPVISHKTKKKIMIETAKACITGTKRKDIAKKYNISLTTVNHLASDNREQYAKIKQELIERVQNRAIFNAEIGLKSIKRSAVKQLGMRDPLKLSMFSKNLYEIATDKSNQNNIQVNINMPKSKDELVNYIFDETTQQLAEK